MRDLIDREKLREDVLKFFPEASNVIDLVIEREPGVEAEPVVHAHWEKVRIPCLDSMGFPDWKRGYKCTNCQTESRYFRKTFKRCPECGARMDEEDKNTWLND